MFGLDRAPSSHVEGMTNAKLKLIQESLFANQESVEEIREQKK
jgi:hypothetical protein